MNDQHGKLDPRQLARPTGIVVSTLALLLFSCGVFDAPEEPLEQAATPQVSQIGTTPHFEIQWHPVANAAGYRLTRIEHSGRRTILDAGHGTRYTDTGFVPEKLYDEGVEWVVAYEVCAVGKNGDDGPWSTRSNQVMFDRPDQPDNITTDSLLEKIRVTWDSDLDVSAEYNYFRVYRQMQVYESPQSLSFFTETDSLYFVDSTAMYGAHNFFYSVTTVLNGVESENTYYVSRLMGSPPPVSNLSFSYDTVAYTVTATWDHSFLERTAPRYHPFLSESTMVGPFDSLGEYRIADLSDSSVTLSNMLRGVPYYLYVRASSNGYATPSETLLVHCGELADTVPAVVPITQISGWSPSTMQVTWELVDGAKEYRVFRKDSLTGSWNAVSPWLKPSYPFRYNNTGFSIYIGNYSFFDEGVHEGFLYFYRVKGRNSFGEGDVNTGTWGATSHSNAAPPEPVTPSVGDVSDNRVALSWDDPGNALYFSILRNDTPDRPAAQTIADSLTVTTFTDTAVPPGDSSYYWIASHGIAELSYSTEPTAVWADDTGSAIITDPSDSTAHLSVMIIDSCTAEALEGAQGFLSGTQLTVVSDTGGILNFGYIPVPTPDTTRLCTVTVSAEGYVTKIHPVEIEVGEYTFSPVQLTPEGGCIADTMMVLTLSNTSTLDLDIHCLIPDTGGANPTDVGTVTGNLFRHPYARKFSNGDENIVISRWYNGVYTVYVRAWSDPFKPSITESGAAITLSAADGSVLQTVNASAASGTGDYWQVCTIDGASGQITVVNALAAEIP